MTRIARKLLVLATAILALGALAGPAAAGVPGYEIGAVGCEQGLVRAYVPRAMLSSYSTDFRNPEQVYWTPELNRYNPYTRAWEPVAVRPWHRAFASSYGIYQAPIVGGWTNTANNASGTMFVPFYGLASGYYAIKNYLHWSWINYTQVHWSGVVCQTV
jgi:hypothetical protein